MVDDPEVLPFLQMAVGYSLTGRTTEEKLFYLYGPEGRNGKGVFTETLLELLNEPLAKEVDFSTFTRDRDNDAQNFDLAALKPTRFIAASESKQHEKLNEAKIKQATGGNKLRCAHKNKPHFEYKPRFKIWLSSNYDVNADANDQAVWSRVVRILFPHTFEGREDRGLKDRLRQHDNLAGVLAWAVEGGMCWYKAPRGLEVPDVFREGAREVREDLDHIQQWLDEETTQGKDAWISNAAAYDSYREWCKDNGVPPKFKNAFGAALKAKKYTQGRDPQDRRNGKRGIQGLRLKGPRRANKQTA